MEIYIDPGLSEISYLLYNSLENAIIEWEYDECYKSYAFSTGVDYDCMVPISKLGIEDICGIVNHFMDRHKFMLDGAKFIYVEGQALNFYGPKKPMVSKMQSWIYMLFARYPNKVHIIWPKSLKLFLGGCQKSHHGNKKKAVEYVDETLSNCSPFYSVWKEQKSFSRRHNLADPFVMMMFNRSVK